MYERLTDRARRVMQCANQEAQRLNHEYIGPEHILLGLIKEGTNTGIEVLKSFQIDLRAIRLKVEEMVPAGPELVCTMGRLPSTPGAKNVLELAIKQALDLGHNHVGTEHLLLGILSEPEGIAGQILRELWCFPQEIEKKPLTLDIAREKVLDLLSFNASAPPPIFTNSTYHGILIPKNPSEDLLEIVDALLKLKSLPPDKKILAIILELTD